MPGRDSVSRRVEERSLEQNLTVVSKSISRVEERSLIVPEELKNAHWRLWTHREVTRGSYRPWCGTRGMLTAKKSWRTLISQWSSQNPLPQPTPLSVWIISDFRFWQFYLDILFLMRLLDMCWATFAKTEFFVKEIGYSTAVNSSLGRSIVFRFGVVIFHYCSTVICSNFSMAEITIFWFASSISYSGLFCPIYFVIQFSDYCLLLSQIFVLLVDCDYSQHR